MRTLFALLTLAGLSFGLAQSEPMAPEAPVIEDAMPASNATNTPTIRVLLGTKWPDLSSGTWYVKTRGIFPLGQEVLGQQLYGIGELGISKETLKPYASASLSIDGPYAGLILTGYTTEGQSPYLTLETSFSFALGGE